MRAGRNVGPPGGCALVAASLFAAAACAPHAEYHRLTGQTMGTEYALTITGGDACTVALAGSAEAELQRVNARLSTWQPTSEVSRFNAAPAGEWVRVSPEFVDIVQLSQKLAHQSLGSFDITVGPLVELWGFGPSTRQGIPTAAEIAVAASRVGHGRLAIRRTPPALRKRVEGLRLDLSAIAKGHAVDRLATLLDDQGCTDYLIDIGGEIRVRGAAPGGGAWRIGIEWPVRAQRPTPLHRLASNARPQTAGAERAESRGEVLRVLHLSDAAVATSGDYRNFRWVGDVAYGHTIDPRSGRPVTHALASVTVVANTAALADGLATAISVLGPSDGYAFADQAGIAALTVSRRDGGLHPQHTTAMDKYLR